MSLNFESCDKISDAGLAGLGAKLPSTLQEMSLNLKWCGNISDAGLAGLGAKLPYTLQKIALDLDGSKISDAGMAAAEDAGKLRAWASQHLAAQAAEQCGHGLRSTSLA